MNTGSNYFRLGKTSSNWLSLVQFSYSVMSDSLRPHEPQHPRPPCPSPTARVYPNSCPLSQCCHPTISFSGIPFSCHQSFPVSESFLMSQLFASGGESIGVSVSTSVLPMNTHKLAQTGSNQFRLVQIGLDWSKMAQTSPNQLGPVKTGSDQFKLAQTNLDWFKLVWTTSDQFKLAWPSSNRFRPVQTIFEELVQSVSDWFQLAQGGLNWITLVFIRIDWFRQEQTMLVQTSLEWSRPEQTVIGWNRPEQTGNNRLVQTGFNLQTMSIQTSLEWSRLEQTEIDWCRLEQTRNNRPIQTSIFRSFSAIIAKVYPQSYSCDNSWLSYKSEDMSFSFFSNL